VHPTGWLSTYLSGYIHRDPSIGNVLTTANPVKRKVFEVPEKFLDHLSLLKDKGMEGEIRVLCERVKQLVVELGISDECTGFIIDGDLAIPWKESFSGEIQGAKWVSCSQLPILGPCLMQSQGTPGFMSRHLATAAIFGEAYLRSPVDDLESFFWVAFWSVLFNEDNDHLLSPGERLVRRELAKGSNGKATICLFVVARTSDIMQRFYPLLKAWWFKLQDKEDEWAEKVELCAPAGAGEDYYLPRFHRSALQGVVDILEVVSRYWNDELCWDSWTGPTQSSLYETLESDRMVG